MGIASVAVPPNDLTPSTGHRKAAFTHDMRSKRFGQEIVITNHARERMAERKVDEILLEALLESGHVLAMGPGRMLIFGHFAERHDNLVCAAVAAEDCLVVKTVMVNWSLRRER